MEQELGLSYVPIQKANRIRASRDLGLPYLLAEFAPPLFPYLIGSCLSHLLLTHPTRARWSLLSKMRRHRQLSDLRQGYPFRSVRSGTRDAGYLGPDLESLSSGRAMSGSSDVGGTAEEVCYLIMNGGEALRLSG